MIILERWDVPVQVTVAESINGTPIVFSRPRRGMPLDVASSVDGASGAWLPRSVLDSLKTMAAEAGATYVLQYNDGSTDVVRFRVEDRPCLAARLVSPDADPAPEDWLYDIQIKLMVL